MDFTRLSSAHPPQALAQPARRRAGAFSQVLCGFLALALAAVAAPTPSLAGTVTYTPVTTTVNGLDMTIFTKPTDNGGALRVATYGKNLWFAEHDTGNFVRFSLAGVGNLFAIPDPGAIVFGIAKGPDKALWFSVWNQPTVGRVTPGGAFTLFNTGTAVTDSNDILAGPDGNLWFATDFQGLGRTTPAGVTQFFNTLTNGSQTTGVTVGGDGNIWYVQCCPSTPQIGRMATDGSGVAQFDVGFGAAGFSFGIASTKTRIWFVDPAHRRIGRINFDGTHLKYFTAGLTGDPAAIVDGPDGNLYFAESQSQVGRITPAGVITEYPIPGLAGTTNFPVLGMSVGPDKNIWFVSNAHAQVGMLKIQ